MAYKSTATPSPTCHLYGGIDFHYDSSGMSETVFCRLMMQFKLFQLVKSSLYYVYSEQVFNPEEGSHL